MSFPHDNEARLDIEDTYDYETLEKISNEGCNSGLCSKHNLYAETLPFFDKHEDEIVSEVAEILGFKTLVDIFKGAEANLDRYRNDVVWIFIEMVACTIVREKEEKEEELVKVLMKEEEE